MGNAIGKTDEERELLKYCKTQGIYPTCPWSEKQIGHMLLNHCIGPLYPPADSKIDAYTDECPICFNYFPGVLNVTSCCSKAMCSECFLQLRTPKDIPCCPYCNHKKLNVSFNGYEPTHPAIRRVLRKIIAADKTFDVVAQNIDDLASVKFSTKTERQKIHEVALRQSQEASLTGTGYVPTSVAPSHSSPPLPDGRSRLWATYLRDGGIGNELSVLEEMFLLEALRQSVADAQTSSMSCADDTRASASTGPSIIATDSSSEVGIYMSSGVHVKAPSFLTEHSAFPESEAGDPRYTSAA